MQILHDNVCFWKKLDKDLIRLLINYMLISSSCTLSLAVGQILNIVNSSETKTLKTKPITLIDQNLAVQAPSTSLLLSCSATIHLL